MFGGGPGVPSCHDPLRHHRTIRRHDPLLVESTASRLLFASAHQETALRARVD